MRAREGESSLELQSGSVIPEMQYGDTYKYLGIAQLFGTNLAATKTGIRKEYLTRMRKVWGGATNRLTKARNHNAWCVGLFQYFFSVVRWARSELTAGPEKSWSRMVVTTWAQHWRGCTSPRKRPPEPPNNVREGSSLSEGVPGGK